MAIAVTPVQDASFVSGNKRVRTLDLVFSGNYATGGESFTASNAGLSKIDFVNISGGVAYSTDLLTANPVAYNHATSKFLFYEGAASGAAVAEKTNAEAYPTGSKTRVQVVGF